MWIQNFSVILSICFSSFANDNGKAMLNFLFFFGITFESKNHTCI